MTDPNKPETFCQRCGNPMAGEGKAYCRQCLIDQAESHIRDTAVETPKFKPWRDTSGGKIVMGLIVLACAATVVYQTPRTLTAFKTLKPVRTGSYATDAATDQCLKTLWRLAHDFQQGGTGVGQPIVCPASGKPYVITPGPNPEIRCPDPGAHGFREILTSKKNPVPELKRD